MSIDRKFENPLGFVRPQGVELDFKVPANGGLPLVDAEQAAKRIVLVGKGIPIRLSEIQKLTRIAKADATLKIKH